MSDAGEKNVTFTFSIDIVKALTNQVKIMEEEKKSHEMQDTEMPPPQMSGGLGGAEPPKKPAVKMTAHEQAVMATSGDALMTKVYAAGLGYFDDPYAKLFLKKGGRKMYPIINRGTWARVQAYR